MVFSSLFWSVLFPGAEFLAAGSSKDDFSLFRATLLVVFWVNFEDLERVARDRESDTFFCAAIGSDW